MFKYKNLAVLFSAIAFSSLTYADKGGVPHGGGNGHGKGGWKNADGNQAVFNSPGQGQGQQPAANVGFSENAKSILQTYFGANPLPATAIDLLHNRR